MLNLETLTQEHNLRKAWPNEAKDFTPWLAMEDNISLLNENISMSSKYKLFSVTHLI